MKYLKIVKQKFIERPNRFVAYCQDEAGEVHKVHVKNTGRCKELLVPGAVVYLEDFEGRMGERKMRHSLIGVEKETEHGTLMVNMDSQAPNKVVYEALQNGKILCDGMSELSLIKPEKKYGDSRFDFYIEDIHGNKGFIEVKGVTLEHDAIASFPDAPTERGVKHVNELMKALDDGYKAYSVFVVQMQGMKYMTPNDEHHKAFGDALRKAKKKGVIVKAYECSVTCDTLEIIGEISVKLE